MNGRQTKVSNLFYTFRASKKIARYRAPLCMINSEDERTKNESENGNL